MIPQFNETKYREDLKRSLGFTDIPDDQLYDHSLTLNSPMGLDETFKLSVGHYIDAEVEIARESYQEVMLEMQKSDGVLPSVTPKLITTEPLSTETKFNSNNIKYYDVDVPVTTSDGHEVRPYTVAVYMDLNDSTSVVQAREQIQRITTHFTFTGERDANFIMGTETIISYYQFVNLVAALVHHTDRQDVLDSIAAKIKMEFADDGIELDDIKQQFGF